MVAPVITTAGTEDSGYIGELFPSGEVITALKREPSPSKLKTVEFDEVATTAGLLTLQAEQGDEALDVSTGRINKLRAGGDPTVAADWVPDVTRSRLYADDAARLARTGFAPEVGETIGILGSVLQYRITDPADNTQDQLLGNEAVASRADIRDAANAGTDLVQEAGIRTELDLRVLKSDEATPADVLAGTNGKHVDAADLKVVNDALDVHVTSRLRPHLPDGGTAGQVPIIQPDDTIAYEDAASFGQHIGDWDVAANAGFPAPVTTTGDWWSVTGVTQAEQDAGGKVWNALTINNGDLLASKDATGTAFTHIRHPAQSALTTPEVTSTSGADYSKFGIVSPERLDEWGRSRRMRRVFNHPGPGNFDFAGLGYPDRTAIFIRNVSSSNGISIDYGTGGANTLNITRASGTTQTITALDSFNIQPSEIAVVEKDGTQVYVSIFPGERVTVHTSYAAAVAGGFTPYDGLVLIRDTGELFGRKTSTNSRPFPADGKENADWYKMGGSSDVTVSTFAELPDPTTVIVGTLGKVTNDGSRNGVYMAEGAAPDQAATTWRPSDHEHENLENIAVHVRSAGTDAGSNVDIELLIDGVWNPTDWVASTAPVTGLESYTGHAPVFLDKASITGPIGISHNKDGWLFFEYVGDATEGKLTGVNYTGANGANSDGQIIVNFEGTNDHVTFANKAAVVDTDWTKQEAVATDTVVYPGPADNMQIGVINIRYQDDPALTPGQIPTPVLGREYVVTILPVNRGDTAGTIEGETTHYFGVNRGLGVEWIATKASTLSDGWFYTTDNMTLPDEKGQQLIFVDTHTINLPDFAGTELFDIEITPANSDWDSLTYTINEAAGWTWPTATAPITGYAASDTLRIIVDPNTKQLRTSIGGGSASLGAIPVADLTDIPAAATIRTGVMYQVLSDATVPNRGLYLATGTIGALATNVVPV